jgi:hypothetical protein
MHPTRTSSLRSPEVPHAAAPPTATDPIPMLEREVLHALECAGRLQRRARAAERELRRAHRELVRSKADSREQLHAMRLELVAMEARCWALDEVCRALLLTIEQAACFELAESPLVAGVSP